MEYISATERLAALRIETSGGSRKVRMCDHARKTISQPLGIARNGVRPGSIHCVRVIGHPRSAAWSRRQAVRMNLKV